MPHTPETSDPRPEGEEERRRRKRRRPPSVTPRPTPTPGITPTRPAQPPVVAAPPPELVPPVPVPLPRQRPTRLIPPVIQQGVQDDDPRSIFTIPPGAVDPGIAGSVPPTGVTPIPIDPSRRDASLLADFKVNRIFEDSPIVDTVVEFVLRRNFLDIANLFDRQGRPIAEQSTEAGFRVEVIKRLNFVLEREEGLLPFLDEVIQEGRNEDTDAILSFLGWHPNMLESFWEQSQGGPRFVQPAPPIIDPVPELVSGPTNAPGLPFLAIGPSILLSLFPNLGAGEDEVGRAWIDRPDLDVHILDGLNAQLATDEGTDALLDTVHAKGRNADTEFILDMLGMTTEQMEQFFAGAPPGEGAALEATMRRIFPDRDLDALLANATSEDEATRDAFWDEVRERGITTDTWALMKRAFPDVPTEEIVAFFAATPEHPSTGFLAAIGDRALGALQYAEGWWQVALMEMGFAFEAAGAPVRELLNREEVATNAAQDMMNDAFKKHGWRAIASGEAMDAWDIYFIERDVRGPAKLVAEFSNPIYFVPFGGTAGLIARPFLRVPMLGRTLAGIARSVQFAETAPFVLPARGVGLGLKGVERLTQRAFGGGAFKGAGDNTIKKYLLKELPTPQQLDEWMFQNDTFKRIAKRIPLLGRAAPATQIGTLPQQLATRTEITQATTKAVLKRQAIIDIGAGQRTHAVASLRELGTTRQIYGVDDLGVASMRKVRPIGVGDSRALGDVVQAPERYLFDHESGFLYAKRATSVTDEALQIALGQGVEMKLLKMPPFKEYIHWVVTGKVDKFGVLESKRVGSRKIGGVTASQQHRRFERQIDGILDGYRYSNDLEVYVSSYIDETFRAIADKRFADEIAEVVSRVEGIIPTKPLDRLNFLYPGVELNWTGVQLQMENTRFALTSVQRARRGEILSGSTMNAIRRRSPAAARELDAAYVLGEKTIDKELARFSKEVFDTLKTTPKRFKQTISELRGQPIDAQHPVRAGQIDEALRFINADAKTSLKMLKQIYRNTHAQRGAQLKSISADLTKEVEDLSPKWFESRAKRAEKFAEVSQPILGRNEARIPHPMFSNQIYPVEIAEQVTKLLNNEVSDFLKLASDISSTAVLLQASLDLSAWSIQGLVAHLAHPINASRATLKMLETAITPGAFDRYLAKNSASMSEREFYLGSQRPFDFFESLGSITRAAERIPGGKWVIGQTYGRAQAAFSMWATVYRDLMWQTGSKTWVKAGKGADFARYLDRSVGMSSFARLGTPANLIALVRGWVSFAPQYRLAVASFFADAFKGGMTGAQVRRDIAKMVGAATTMYVAWAKATDNPIFLDPFRDGKKFMSMNVDGHWIGPGSAVISMMRASADIAASVIGLGDNEPMDFFTFDKWKNPIIRGWLTQSAPLPRIAIEAALQQDFLGFPLETPQDWAYWALENVTPIMAQDIFFDKSGVPVTTTSAIASIAGLRSSPESRWEALDEQLKNLKAWEAVSNLTEEQLAELEGESTVLSVLSKFQKVEMFNALESSHPEVIEQYGLAIEDAFVRGSAPFRNYISSVEGIKEDAAESLNKAMDVGIKIDGKDTLWLRDSYADAMTIYGAKNEAFREVEEYQGLFDEWDESREKRIPDAEVFDLAYWDYIENVVAPDRSLPNGDFDFEAYNEALVVFEQRYGREMHDQVRFVLEDGKREAGFPEWSIRLWNNRTTINRTGYWDLPAKAIGKFTQNDLNNGVVPDELISTVQTLLALDDEAREQRLEANEFLSVDAREELRIANPELDAILGVWHYGGKVQTMAAVELMRKWSAELGIPFSAMGGGLPAIDVVQYFFEYEDVEVGQARLQYRRDNPSWEQYLVDVQGYTPVGDRGRPRPPAIVTPTPEPEEEEEKEEIVRTAPQISLPSR